MEAPSEADLSQRLPVKREPTKVPRERHGRNPGHSWPGGCQFVSWVDLVGWWPRFEAQVLDPLLSGSDAHYQVRDWENDEFGTSLQGWKRVVWSPVVVFEGLTCTRAAAADRLAYRIWVQAPEQVRLRRGLERDGQTHRELWLASMITERQFFTDDATRTRADLRVDGNPGISHDQESEIVLLD